MPGSQRAERPYPRATPERQRFIAAVEAGLADVEVGRVDSHAEVQAEMRQRFPPPK